MSHMINYSSLCVTMSSFTASVYFEIRDQSTNKQHIRQFPGNVMREESHQVRLNYNNTTMCSMYNVFVESSCCEDSPDSLQ